MKKTYKLLNVPLDCTGDFGIERVAGSISTDNSMAFGVCRAKLDQYFELDEAEDGTQYWVEINSKQTRHGHTIKRVGPGIEVDGEDLVFFQVAADVLRTILKDGKVYYVSMWKA